MPSAIIHRCVNKRVLEEIKKYTTEEDKYLYDIGSIAPDSWRNTLEFIDSQLPKKEKRKYSHFSKDNEFVENYDIFLNKYKQHINNPFIFGYLVHLMTDNYWRIEMYYKTYYKDAKIDNELLNIEHSGEKSTLNKDIETLSKEIAQHYNINKLEEISDEEINKLPKIDELSYDGINTTIKYINNQLTQKINNEVIEFDISKMINGIEICTKLIVNELKDKEIVK